MCISLRMSCFRVLAGLLAVAVAGQVGVKSATTASVIEEDGRLMRTGRDYSASAATPPTQDTAETVPLDIHIPLNIHWDSDKGEATDKVLTQGQSSSESSTEKSKGGDKKKGASLVEEVVIVRKATPPTKDTTETVPLDIHVPLNIHWDSQNGEATDKVLTKGTSSSESPTEKSKGDDKKKVTSKDASLVEEAADTQKEMFLPSAGVDETDGISQSEKEMLSSSSPLAEAFSRRYTHSHFSGSSAENSGEKQRARSAGSRHKHAASVPHHQTFSFGKAFAFPGPYGAPDPKTALPKFTPPQEAASDLVQARQRVLSQEELKEIKRHQKEDATKHGRPTHYKASAPMPSAVPSPTPQDGFS